MAYYNFYDGYTWPETYGAYGPRSSTGIPYPSDVSQTNPQYVITGDQWTGWSTVSGTDNSSPVGTATNIISEYWRFDLTGQNLIDICSIPAGSRIDKISFNATHGATSGKLYKWRAKMTTSLSFSSSWLNIANSSSNAQGVMTYDRTFSTSGSWISAASRSPISGSYSWQATPELAWDFLAGDNFVTSRTYIHFWLEYPAVCGTPESRTFKGLKISRVDWTPPSASSGILLGSL